MLHVPLKYKSLVHATLGLVALNLASIQAQPLVVLDAGHGGNEPGASYGGIHEKTVNLGLCLAVEHHLHGFGIDTALTRSQDATVSLADRAHYPSNFPETLFVSLHYNAAPNRAARGIETFYANNASKEFAVAVQHRLISSMRAEDRMVKNGGRLKVLRLNRAPKAILIEGGFMSNPQDLQLIADPRYRDRQAYAIAQGIVDHIQMSEPSMTMATSFVSNQPFRPNPSMWANVPQPRPPHTAPAPMFRHSQSRQQAYIVNMRPNQNDGYFRQVAYHAPPRPVKKRRFLGFLR